MDELDDLMARREAAARAYTTGDAGPLLALATRGDAATFLGPGGTLVSGGAAVRADFAEGAAMFGPGSTTRFEVEDRGMSGDLAWWTGIQAAEAELKGKEGLVPMRLRITEVFRREAGGWRLVHRHASEAKGA